jgi:hypothetical protein
MALILYKSYHHLGDLKREFVFHVEDTSPNRYETATKVCADSEEYEFKGNFAMSASAFSEEALYFFEIEMDAIMFKLSL